MTSSTPALKWSSTFRLMDVDETKRRNLAGDKIVLPHSALEQLLLAAETANNNAVRDAGDYSRRQPHDSQQLPHPLMFRLVNPATNKAVFAGIREFSADEGFIGLSPYLLKALGIDAEAHAASDKSRSSADSTDAWGFGSGDASAGSALNITVHAQQAPRGTFVRLRPLEAGYDSGDWKALLEHQLRARYTTLTKDTVLTFNNGLDAYSFLIDQFKPDNHDGICVVDTDLEVDMQPLNDEQARESARILAERSQQQNSKSSDGGEIDIWNPANGQVVPGEYVNYDLFSWDRSRALEFQLSGLADDVAVDMFVSPLSDKYRSRPERTHHMFGAFEATSPGIKSIIIPPSHAGMENAELLMVAIYGYIGSDSHQQPASFTLRARVAPDPSEDLPMKNTGAEHGLDEEQCKSCQNWIPKRTMMLHENFCRRQNVVCPQCRDVFLKSSEEWANHWHCEHDSSYGSSSASKAKHDQIFHEKHTCELCHREFGSLPALSQHHLDLCPYKLILCQFCHLEVPQEGDPDNPTPELILSGLTAHEFADGARTTECHLCDKIVRLRDMKTHLKTHDLDKASRSTPLICRNVSCGRTRFGVGARGAVREFADASMVDRLGLCAVCFEPLFATTFDPDGKAMQRRVERRYLKQLMGGCGKQACRNEWCRTGRKNSGLPERGARAAEALALVKPLLGSVRKEDAPMYFCVEEMSAQRRAVAEAVAGEGVYELEWCVAAAEASSGDLDGIRSWLDNWAPRKA